MVGRRYSARVTIAPIDAGPESGGISPVTVPATAVGAIVTVTPTALAVAPVGFVMSDGTAHAGSKESVVSNEVPATPPITAPLRIRLPMGRTIHR